MQTIKLNKHKIKQKFIPFNYIFAAFIVFLIICLISSPAKYINSATNGISLWVNNLVPALFPFFVLSKILMELNVMEKFCKPLGKCMHTLFGTNANSSYIFFLSILSGYPLGSKLVLDAYNLKQINIVEAHRMVTFTSVSGPLFIIGTVGTTMLINQTCGYIIFISHIIGAFINGVLFRKYVPKGCDNLVTVKQTLQNQNKNKNILTDSISSAINSILLIGGLVCIFYVGMEAVCSIINLPNIIQGLFEITNGCHLIANEIGLSIQIKTCLACAIITFGGFCTHAQAMFFLKSIGISYSFFIKQKLVHTLCSTLLCVVLCFIFL